MHKPQTKKSKIYTVILLLTLFILGGCENEQSANQNSTKNVPPGSEPVKTSHSSDNLDELLNFVRIPVLPDEVVWKEESTANPKKIVAVLKFTPQSLQEFSALIEKNKQADAVDVGVEDWFPEELTAQSQLSGQGMLKGTAYAANDFYNIPYGSGRVVRISGTDYFVLELTANN